MLFGLISGVLGLLISLLVIAFFILGERKIKKTNKRTDKPTAQKKFTK